MSFDLRPEFSSQAGDGQLYNSENIAPDEFYNCTWEGLRQTARASGYGGYDDQQLRNVANVIFGRGNYGQGERWETNVAVAQRLWPALGATMSVEYPGDVVAAIKSYGEHGSRVHCGFWCDTAAWVPPKGAISYSHALLSLWADGGGVGWVNPEPHPDVYLSDSQIRGLYDGGGILVFGGNTLASAEFDQLQGELQSHDGAIRDLQTREATAEGSLGAHDGAIRDLQTRLAAAEKALAAAKSGLPGPAGPAGPPGPKGDPGVIPTSVIVTGGSLELK